MKKAQSLIEYTIILVIISAVAIMTLSFLGKKATFKNTNRTQTINNEITETMTNYCKNKGLLYNTETQTCEEEKTQEEPETK